MANVAEIVTERIISQLQAGIVPWHKPWTGNDLPINYVSRKKYSGINLLMLDKGGEWLTFKQCADRGGKVKKGEKSSRIVFYKFVEADADEDAEDGHTKAYPVIQYSNIFHISQCEGIETKIKPNLDIVPNASCDAAIASYIDRYGITFTEANGSSRAFYSPTKDSVTVPDKSQFETVEEFYSTVFHELIHSTGAASRLNRIKDRAAFGSAEYSKEELVAEIGSAMILTELGVHTEKAFNNSAAYIGGWLKAIKDGDSRMVISAASQAQKAVDMILGRKKELTAESASSKEMNNK